MNWEYRFSTHGIKDSVGGDQLQTGKRNPLNSGAQSRKIDYNLSSRKSSLTGLKSNIEPLKVAEHSPSRTDISPLHPRWDWKKCGACSIIRLSENICALAEVSIINFLPFTTQSISHDSFFDLNDPLLRKQRLKRPREKYISKKNFVSAWIEPITSQGGGSGGKDITWNEGKWEHKIRARDTTPGVLHQGKWYRRWLVHETNLPPER